MTVISTNNNSTPSLYNSGLNLAHSLEYMYGSSVYYCMLLELQATMNFDMGLWCNSLVKAIFTAAPIQCTVHCVM